jgi:hypothetical protein
LTYARCIGKDIGRCAAQQFGDSAHSRCLVAPLQMGEIRSGDLLYDIG